MKFLILGDIMGKAGRQCIDHLFQKAVAKHNPDFTIANAENISGGRGMNQKAYRFLIEKHGVDCITLGNHWRAKAEIESFGMRQANIVFPGNMSSIQNLDHSYRIFMKGGCKIAVINLIGQAFMNSGNQNPFHFVDKILDRLPDDVSIKIVDFHAEASSEKQAMLHYLRGRVSLVYGTHTHVQTADERILKGSKGVDTGYITDVGMTGPYDSVIGMKKESSLLRFVENQRSSMVPAKNDLWLCALVCQIDQDSGNCLNISKFRWEYDNIHNII